MTTPPKVFVFKGDRLDEPDWRTQTHFVLGLTLRLATPQEGGRSTPLGPFGPNPWVYRPDWGFEGLNHPREMCGAPVMFFERDLVPVGATQRAVIWNFGSRDKWDTVQPRSELFMYEGPHLCGRASVEWKEEVQPQLSDEQMDRFRQWAVTGELSPSSAPTGTGATSSEAVPDIPEPRDLLAELASNLSAAHGALATLGVVDLAGRAQLLRIARDVAHATERQNAPLAAYLIGRFVETSVCAGISETDAIEEASSIVRSIIGDGPG